MAKFQCPCCGNFTLSMRAYNQGCAVCFWEDDEAFEEFGKPAPERYIGGNQIHLWQARENYLKFGAALIQDKPYVCLPKPGELPGNNQK